MGPGGFGVTPEYVANAAASCDSTAAQLQAQLASLKSYVMNLQASWRGIASDTFQILMTDYDIFAQILNNALINIAHGLRGNYVNYEDTEQQNINNLQGINGDIPGAYLD
jgi:WXG100 family type VII secretion target